MRYVIEDTTKVMDAVANGGVGQVQLWIPENSSEYRLAIRLLLYGLGRGDPRAQTVLDLVKMRSGAF